MPQDQDHARVNLAIRFEVAPDSQPVNRRQRFEEDSQTSRKHVEYIKSWVQKHRMQNHVLVVDAVPSAGLVLVQVDKKGERHLRRASIPAKIIELGQIDIELL